MINKLINSAKHHVHKLALQRELHNDGFTLISQNCVGGVLYHLLGKEFLSPTINMFIEDENFVKLAENPSHYFSLDAVPKCEKYIDPINPNISYPIIAVDDIELCCLHYGSCIEAIEKWNSRRKRVNLDNAYIIANSWNLHHSHALAKRVAESPHKNVIFALEDWTDIASCVKLSGDFWRVDARGMVRPDLTDIMYDGVHYYFEKQFDFVKWLNQKE